MIRLAILGYGNLGKAVEQLATEYEQIQLVGIFSRRKLNHPLYFDASSLEQFVGKIDVVAVCTASVDETVDVVKNLAGKFCTVDAYDNHNNIKRYQSSLDCLAKQGKTTNIVAVGWDPGILSMVRAICSSVDGRCQTFWGKGVSQGHTNALKKVAGVVDGIQFTLPKRFAIAKARRGQFAKDSKAVCVRRCYVVANNKKGLKRRIRDVEDYFEGYRTQVWFVSAQKLDKLKQNKGHKGRIEFVGKNCKMSFALSTSYNALLTAEIMLAYANIVSRLQEDGQFGAFSCLDIPLRYLCKGDEL